ncbi:tRNA-U20-dihydrouridine synthase [Archangium gephyra]|uniref:tRNA-dihydrouridine synthase n=1 Tax=Archangium gephyra TaxID=48 RepID=A0AAC8TFB9_9BACT|nr:tRNA-dihydrouridine synthase family protein [Archangium gephyra]AKJ03897.1 tRNA dihydrouridine synthase B [Archangium gephyra]REG23674.1 tRNA-U20-dihydrouridine synthase [Archangium gephyra]
MSSDAFSELFASRPVLLAPMEDVSDAIFRRICRRLGADVCFTEFVNVDNLLQGCSRARRKLWLAEDDRPTAIQIYGADPERLVEVARLSEAAGPAFIDINCGCWVPSIARRGAGAGWLREPEAMVAMAARVVRAVSLPVTVKTRIGLGPEDRMPIVELARRLEDVGVRALTVHCRTAKMGYTGAADWRWAALAQAAVRIPVVVNGDIRTAADVGRVLAETGCAGAMLGRGAIAHPWVFREVKALRAGHSPIPPAPAERLGLLHEHLLAQVAARGEGRAGPYMRRYLAGYLSGVEGGAELRAHLNHSERLEDWLERIAALEARLSSRGAWERPPG